VDVSVQTIFAGGGTGISPEEEHDEVVELGLVSEQPRPARATRKVQIKRGDMFSTITEAFVEMKSCPSLA
jgi:hypothetical protein